MDTLGQLGVKNLAPQVGELGDPTTALLISRQSTLPKLTYIKNTHTQKSKNFSKQPGNKQKKPVW